MTWRSCGFTSGYGQMEREGNEGSFGRDAFSGVLRQLGGWSWVICSVEPAAWTAGSGSWIVHPRVSVTWSYRRVASESYPRYGATVPVAERH